MKYLFAGAIAAVSLVLVLGDNHAGEKAKYTIPQVMKKAMAGGLCKKVASGKANDEEKTQLVELFTALSQNTPPKGDADDWKSKTKALLEAAKGAAGGDADAAKKLPKLANCNGCHSVHKGKE